MYKILKYYYFCYVRFAYYITTCYFGPNTISTLNPMYLISSYSPSSKKKLLMGCYNFCCYFHLLILEVVISVFLLYANALQPMTIFTFFVLKELVPDFIIMGE